MKVKSGAIELKGLRFHAFHGVMEQERVTGGEFIVDLRVDCDLSEAVRTDEVTGALNYAELYEIIKFEMKTPSNLLEHLAGRIGAHVMTAFPQVQEVTVTVTKKNPPMGAELDGAAVTLHLINDKS